MAVKSPDLRPEARRRSRSSHQEESTGHGRGRFASLLRNAPKADPTFIPPMKCKPVDAVPQGKWIVELKLDGFRALGIKNGQKVEVISRNQKELSRRFPQVWESLGRLRPEKITLDGEIVALDEQGRPSFQSLQDIQGSRAARRIFYYAFDVINYEGRDLTGLPIEARRMILAEALAERPTIIRLSEHIEGPVEHIIEAVKGHGLEGIIAKKPGSPYQPGQRTGVWIKYKTLREQEFVIGGYTPPQGSRSAFGALLVGYYEGGQLRFATKVGSGFRVHVLRGLRELFERLIRKECPFVNVPEARSGRWGQGLTASEMRKCVWVEPRLVCQVGFTEWTDGGHLRHPVFKGMREDKNASEVVRE